MSYPFVFVHGASHGGWCWYKISSMLQSSGNRATSIDLQGAGINITDPNTVLSLDQYSQPLYTFLSKLPADEKVILVGHSIGGGSITAAMCKFPDKIAMAVYLAAAMIKPGTPEFPEFLKIPFGLQKSDEYDYIYGQGPNEFPTGVIMKPQYIREKYYNQSPLQDSALASVLLRPGPCRAFLEVGSLPETPAVENIPRVYMKTTKDNMFPPSRQDLMVRQWPPSKVFDLDGSDHSAFFSVPEALYACLINAVSSM